MAFRDVMSSYINSLAPRGGAGRTTITGMGRDSGAKYRAMMAGMQEQARQKQQMERRLMPSAPMQQAPTQPVQQAPPVVAPAAGAAAPTAGGGPTNWQRAFPRMQGMGIGMIQGAQVSPYNRAPNWATSLAGGFQGAEQYGQAADARALEGAQEDRTTSLRAQIAQILRSETELTVEDIQEMVALAMEAKDVPLAQNLIRLLQDTQDRKVAREAAVAGPAAPEEDWQRQPGIFNDPETGESAALYIDANSGKARYTAATETPDEPTGGAAGEADVPEVVAGFNAITGEPGMMTKYAFNQPSMMLDAQGRPTGVPGVKDDPRMEETPGTAEARTKAMTFATSAGPHFNNVINYNWRDYTGGDAAKETFSGLEGRLWGLGDFPARLAQSGLEEEDRIMIDSAKWLAEAWLRLTTGAAYTMIEKSDAERLFMRRPATGFFGGESGGSWSEAEEKILVDNVKNLNRVLQLIAYGQQRKLTELEEKELRETQAELNAGIGPVSVTYSDGTRRSVTADDISMQNYWDSDPDPAPAGTESPVAGLRQQWRGNRRN